MRVTFLGQNSPDKFSGGRYHAWMMAEAAAQMGHTVRFVTDNKPYFYGDFASYPQHRAIQLDYQPVLKPSGWDLPDHACDVLVVVPHGSPSPFYYLKARMFAARKRARLVLLSFETPNWFNMYAREQRDPELWDGWKFCSEGASVVLSSTEEGQKYAKEYYATCPKRTLFLSCYPPINTVVADAVVGGEREKQIVLIVRFNHADHKGGGIVPELFCEAMRGYTLKIIVGIGKPPDVLLGRLESLAAQYGVTLEFLYQVSDEEKFRELKRSALMLYPSFFEGFGLPPVEAQYCDLPCIAYELPVLREVSGKGLMYVPFGDSSAFREKVVECLGAAGRAKNLKQGIGAVARFENYAARVDDVLRRTMSEGRVVEDLSALRKRMGIRMRYAGQVASGKRHSVSRRVLNFARRIMGIL